ncbi:MAG: tetratricopeptide repeat protein [Chitinophagales bacterium]
MDYFITRAHLLIEQGKYDLAERELRHGLTQDVNNADAHALLSLCYIRQKKTKEALEEAKVAIGLDPSEDFSHYILAMAYLEDDLLEDAEKTIREAIRLNPYNPEYFNVLGILSFNRRKMEEALDYFEQSLALDAENVEATNMRARVLVTLGRKEEAANTFQAAFNRNPENAYTHANQGWAELELGNYKSSLEHFRQALRLDPEMDYAKSGMVEALKAKHWIYRAFLKFMFWTGRMSSQARIGLVLGLIFIANMFPIFLPFYLLLVFFTWFATTIFDTLLRFNQYGKHALSNEQIKTSNYFAGCLGIGLIVLIAGFVMGNMDVMITGGVVLGMLFPISRTFVLSNKQSRKKSFRYMVIVGIVGLIALILPFIMPGENLFLDMYIFGIVGYTWYVNFLN